MFSFASFKNTLDRLELHSSVNVKFEFLIIIILILHIKILALLLQLL